MNFLPLEKYPQCTVRIWYFTGVQASEVNENKFLFELYILYCEFASSTSSRPLQGGVQSAQCQWTLRKGRMWLCTYVHAAPTDHGTSTLCVALLQMPKAHFFLFHTLPLTWIQCILVHLMFCTVVCGIHTYTSLVYLKDKSIALCQLGSSLGFPTY